MTQRTKNHAGGHLSMKGVMVDMEALAASQQESIALTGHGSGSKLNARGDLMGRNGAIKRRREDLVKEYNKDLEGNARTGQRSPLVPDTFETPTEVIARLKQEKESLSQPPVAKQRVAQEEPVKQVAPVRNTVRPEQKQVESKVEPVVKQETRKLIDADD